MEELPVDLCAATYYSSHGGLSNKSLGNQEAARSKEQMWHVVRATVAFTLDTLIQ